LKRRALQGDIKNKKQAIHEKPGKKYSCAMAKYRKYADKEELFYYCIDAEIFLQ